MKLKVLYDFQEEYWDSIKKEEIEKDSEFWDDISKEYDKTMCNDLSRVDNVLEILNKLKVLNKDSTALDIGSGTGIFTVPLSKSLKKVYALDMSVGMNNVLREKISNDNIKNVEIIEKEWKTFYIEAKDDMKKYDIVLASLNPAIYNAKAIKEISQISKEYCVYIAPTSKNSGEKGEKDIIHAFNIVYSLGYMPSISYTRLKDSLLGILVWKTKI